MTDLIDESTGSDPDANRDPDPSASAGVDTSAPAAWGEPHRKTVSWYDPRLSLAERRQMTGLEYVRAMAEGRLPPPPIASVIGFRLSSVQAGEVTVACAPDESLINTSGLVHGGVLCTLMDTAMGIAVQTTLGVGVASVTIELKVSFLKPLPFDGREVTVTGHVLKSGRRVSFAEAHTYSPDGVLIGHGTSSLATMQP